MHSKHQYVMRRDMVLAPMVSFAPTVYKQFNKPTLTISHCPCKIKLDASTLSFAYFTWLGAVVNRTASYLRTYDHNNDQIIAYLFIPFGPSIENAKPTKERETDTRQPHIRNQPYVSCGTSLA